MNLAELGEAFRNARLIANLTQDEVAQRTGVPRARISLFENGALSELGAVKMLNLFHAVGLELLPRPAGHRRTLDDVKAEGATPEPAGTRRRARRGTNHPTTGDA